MRKITFSVAIPSNVYDLLPKIKQHMQDHGMSSFSDGTISRSDAVSYAIRKYGESLGFEVNDNGLDLEFVTADQIQDKQVKDQMENQLCSILARDAWELQEEFVQGNYRNNGMDIFDFCDEKRIDWNKTIIENKIITCGENEQAEK